MKLGDYLSLHGIDPVAFGQRIGRSKAQVYRYISGESVPRKATLQKIERETEGAVTANDFFSMSEAEQQCSGIAA